MRSYNPAKSPDRAEWRALSERDRIDLIYEYHDFIGETGENMEAHAAIHAAIETQIAEDVPEIRVTLGRLRKQGLNRHDAIHALGSILAQHMQNIINSSYEDGVDQNAQYSMMLASFDVADWYADE